MREHQAEDTGFSVLLLCLKCKKEMPRVPKNPEDPKNPKDPKNPVDTENPEDPELLSEQSQSPGYKDLGHVGLLGHEL